MYKIIGADGKEYGPVSAEQLKQWLAENRVNAQTKILPDGATEWKPLGEIPELAVALPLAASPTPAPAVPQRGMASAADQVRGPATGLMVTAVLGFVVNLLGTLWNLMAAAGWGFAPMGRNANPEMERVFALFTGTLGVVSGVVALGVAGVIFVGALKMKRLESHGWAMAASILALAPCVSPCCLIGLPIGIWALVVLAKPEVKAAFQQKL
jgi:hypothetical protein